MWGDLFSTCFVALRFFQYNLMFAEIVTKSDPNIYSTLVSVSTFCNFLETLVLYEPIMFLLYFEVSICSKAYQKHCKNKALTKTTEFLSMEKQSPEKSENGIQLVFYSVTLFPAIPLWRPWWHLWRPSLFFNNFTAKVTHKCQRWLPK